MLLERRGGPLVLRERSLPPPGPGEVLLAVLACGVCRTDLHLLDGELSQASLPRVPGHQIVGRVLALGPGVGERGGGPRIGERVGVPWLASTCGQCEDCRAGRENLCPQARFTGCHVDGGFAEHCLAQAAACLPLPEALEAAAAAPLLCAGLIGHRALRLAGNARRLGLYGFGASAHIVAQLARWQGRQVYAFTRPGDLGAQALARELGAVWAGGSDELPPAPASTSSGGAGGAPASRHDAAGAPAAAPLDAAIVFAAVGALVPQALAAVRPGGTVVTAGIHMSDIPSFPYRLLWGERVLRSVANLTRADGREFLALAPRVPIVTHVTAYPLAEANEALAALRAGRHTGALVLTPGA